MNDRLSGIVKWFSNEHGFGFIYPVGNSGGPDTSVEYFVHFSSINMRGFKNLSANQAVTFSLKDTPKGLQAVEVEPTK